ncbi:hypothetical protein [Sessilibacter corallicola]|uniref:MoxR-vWA-beta-propeller ternary system domain-containing protein n=1 Tax=Sessilibacter corallicola TaxID=2904075 RepID=A0ABQ0A8D8_9GAMM
MKVTWQFRDQPLVSTGLLAGGDLTKMLVKKLLQREDFELRQLTGVASTDAIAITGVSLPWLPGVSYFGVDPLAPQLLIPTHLTPSVSIELLERKIQFSNGKGIYIIDPTQRLIFPLAKARPLDRSKLEAIVA